MTVYPIYVYSARILFKLCAVKKDFYRLSLDVSKIRIEN